jgi:hypothetical protein
MKHITRYTLLKTAEVSNMASDVSEELLGGRKYPFSYSTGEMQELVEALRDMDKEGIKEEWQDVLYALQMYGHQNTGVDFKLRGVDDTLEKFRNRRAIWQKLFGSKGLEFDKQYLQGGSNYRKPEKIRNAFRLAGHELSDDDLVAMEELIGTTYEIPVGG